VSKAGWYVHFREPILTPKGALLITLRDAGDYITRLPKAEHDTKAWQTAMHCLLQAADSGGPTDFARIGMMQALYPMIRFIRRGARSRNGVGPNW
jgi:hypothetical protein